MAKTLFFAGTDTDVGKTYVASLAAKSLHHSGVRVGVYKPVASGCTIQEGQLVASDAQQLWQAAGKPRSLDDVCPQKFVAAVAPNVAARAEGRAVDREWLLSGANAWREHCDVLIVEGAGGLLSPLADGLLNIDFYKRLRPAELVIVAANRLGVIHQTLSTCAAARQFQVAVAGIILCSPSDRPDESVADNASEIAAYTDVPIWGQVDFGADKLPPEIENSIRD